MSARVCMITGAGQGIGRAVALHFASRGYRVALAERNEAAAHAVAAEIAEAGGQALALPTDVTDTGSVNACVERIASAFGGCDVLINNARWSGLSPTPVQDLSDADWRQAMEVNVTGAFHCIRAVAPHMISAGWGRIINMSSATVRKPPSRPYVHYITSKAALIGLTRSLAQELGAHGITVNALLPGAVETGVVRPNGLSDADREKNARATQAIPRVLRSGDLAGAAFFLASEDAGFITGQSLAVDGGFSFG